MTHIPQKPVNVHQLSDGCEFGPKSVVGNRLIVHQTRSGHEKVVEVLEVLEEAVETP